MGPDTLRVVQVSIGRFHHFHLARQMERFGLLRSIWTGYPRFKLKDETGIPAHKIRSFPWLQTLFMGWSRVPLLGRSTSLQREIGWLAQDTLDRRVARALTEAPILVALSGQGLHCGTRAKALGGRYVCDRGSSHIRFQDEIMREEHERWRVPYRPIDCRVVEKEEREYAEADLITVPSGFAYRSFVAQGVPEGKLRRIPYGGRLDRFRPERQPSHDRFDVLFVGHVSMRKGIGYLLEAFGRFNHPGKRLRIIGDVDQTVKPLIAALPTDRVSFLGTVANPDLVRYYNEAHVLVLPSLEEGLAMVMAEAMACGCPVIATPHTGAEDLFEDGREGHVVPIRSSDAILRAFERLADDRAHAAALRVRAAERIRTIDGWNRYGLEWKSLIEGLHAHRLPDPEMPAP